MAVILNWNPNEPDVQEQIIFRRYGDDEQYTQVVSLGITESSYIDRTAVLEQEPKYVIAHRRGTKYVYSAEVSASAVDEVPGPSKPIFGNTTNGYYGYFPVSEFPHLKILYPAAQTAAFGTSNTVASHIHKFVRNGKHLFVPNAKVATFLRDYLTTETNGNAVPVNYIDYGTPSEYLRDRSEAERRSPVKTIDGKRWNIRCPKAYPDDFITPDMSATVIDDNYAYSLRGMLEDDADTEFNFIMPTVLSIWPGVQPKLGMFKNFNNATVTSGVIPIAETIGSFVGGGSGMGRIAGIEVTLREKNLLKLSTSSSGMNKDYSYIPVIELAQD